MSLSGFRVKFCLLERIWSFTKLSSRFVASFRSIEYVKCMFCIM